MKGARRLLITLLIAVFTISMLQPAREASAASKYGVVLGTKDYNFTLNNSLTVLSPAGNLMVKAYSLSKALGLTYSYNTDTKKLTIKNPVTGKYLVYTNGSSTFTYYSGNTAKPAVKTATYKCYYDSVTNTYVVHASSLKYIVTYNYYKDLSGSHYGEMGYKGVLVYSMNGYSSYDMPVTAEVLNYINSKTFTSAQELLDAVRLNLMMRNTNATFQTYRSVMDAIGTQETVMDQVLDIDQPGTSKDADYLSLLIDQIRQKWTSYQTIITHPDGRQEVVKSPDDQAVLTISVQYETGLGQERVVDSKVASILKSLKLTDATQFEKVKKIHDYVINLASYDDTRQQSSAYDLLINKSAVCEGYALSAYRLLTDTGLECKIITGTGDGESHAWNIVKVDGEWYNLDLTWDDPISSSGQPILDYDYFLKNETDFTNHIRDAQFRTAEYLDTYTIAEESYPWVE